MRLGKLAYRLRSPALLGGRRRLDEADSLQLLEQVGEGERLVNLEEGVHAL